MRTRTIGNRSVPAGWSVVRNALDLESDDVQCLVVETLLGTSLPLGVPGVRVVHAGLVVECQFVDSGVDRIEHLGTA